ncbi:MAG: winged helix-turn-helix domain-containing protein [Pseudomonadales bacterium]
MDLADGFRLDDWQVLPREGRIVRTETGDSVRVRRKAMDVLCVLAANAGQVVERDDLLAAVWGRTAVTDEPLTATIGELRRLLGERQGDDRRYIETIPKRGYRLLHETVPIVQAARPAATATLIPDETAPPARLAPRVRLDWKTLAVGFLVIALALFAYQRFSQPPVAATPERSVAVLPFTDMSRDADQAYFADGLAEELISLLTRLPALRVAARNSAFAFRDQDLPITDIAMQLNVAHVLTGSVRRLGERVRVTAQLVDARNGYQLWSDSYDRTLDDIFGIQDDIASEVTAQLAVQLLGDVPQTREVDPAAYTLYLQARHIGRQLTEEGLENAEALYRQSLDIDPDYPPAWNDLAGVYVNMVGHRIKPREEGYDLARAAALRALALDPDSAMAFDRLGWIALYHDNDLRAAAGHYERALSLAPTDDAIRSDAAVLALAIGRLEMAIALFESAVDTDPVSAVSHANLGNAYRLARRYPEAEAAMRRTVALSPQYVAGHYRLGLTLLAQGDLDGARAAMEAEPLEAAKLLGRAMVWNAEGRFDESDTAIRQVRERYGDQGAGNYAQLLAHRGDIDGALRWLEVELAANGTGAFLEYRFEPLFEALHADPRWQALLERAGVADAQIADIDFPTLDELALTAPEAP